MGWVIFVTARAVRRRLRRAIDRIAAAGPDSITARRGSRAILRPEAAASRRRCTHASTNELFTDIRGSAVVTHRLRLSVRT